MGGQAFAGAYMWQQNAFLSHKAADQGQIYRFQDCSSKTSPVPNLPQSRGTKLHTPITTLLLLKWHKTKTTVQKKEKYLREKQLLEYKQNST